MILEGAFQQRLRDFTVEAKAAGQKEARMYHDSMQTNFKIEMNDMIDQFNNIRQELFTTESQLLNQRLES